MTPSIDKAEIIISNNSRLGFNEISCLIFSLFDLSPSKSQRKENAKQNCFDNESPRCQTFFRNITVTMEEGSQNQLRHGLLSKTVVFTVKERKSWSSFTPLTLQ